MRLMGQKTARCSSLNCAAAHMLLSDTTQAQASHQVFSHSTVVPQEPSQYVSPPKRAPSAAVLHLLESAKLTRCGLATDQEFITTLHAEVCQPVWCALLSVTV